VTSETILFKCMVHPTRNLGWTNFSGHLCVLWVWTVY